jgi:hypothetical protein
MNVSQEIGLRGIHLGTAGAGALVGSRALVVNAPTSVSTIAPFPLPLGVVKSLPAGGSRILFAAYYKPAADMVTLVRPASRRYSAVCSLMLPESPCVYSSHASPYLCGRSGTAMTMGRRIT